MAYRVVLAGVAVALVFTGCGDTSTTSVADGGDDSAPGSSADAAAVDCGGSVYEPGALADAPPASSLPDGPAGAVDDAGAPAFDASQDWKVVHQSDDRVELVRELDEPVDKGGGDVRTHESRTLERITDAPNVADGAWLLTSAGRCAPRLVTDDDLGDADLALADAPSPGDTSVDLLVRERACASGQTAEGRIEVVELTETADQVRLRIGVRAAEGDQTCQSNPATPFTVELSDPLGDRDIVDASAMPPRPITITSDRRGSAQGAEQPMEEQQQPVGAKSEHSHEETLEFWEENQDMETFNPTPDPPENGRRSDSPREREAPAGEPASIPGGAADG